MNDVSRGGLWHLSPFFLFVSIFLGSSVFLGGAISPLFACLVAIIFSLFTFERGEGFNEKVEIFVRGSSRPTIIAMCYIFIFTAIFTYILGQIGAIQAAVQVGLALIPSSLMLPGLFAIVGLFATAIGSSMGTIAAFLPIGVGIAGGLGVSPALMSGLVVSGAMLGDNLSIISDTTIAATQTLGTTMRPKFRENLRLVWPALILTLLVLTVLNGTYAVTGSLATVALSNGHWVKIIPYGLIFALALLGIDVIAVLVAGILCAAGIGVWLGRFSPTGATSLILEGFSKNQGGIHEVLILSLFIGGLSGIVEHNGGITYLLERAQKRIKNRAQAEWAIAILIFLINAAVAINTIAILITGPVAKQIGDKYGVPHARNAALVDVISCVCQGILPYAPQLLLAGAIAGISSVSIMPYLHYQFFILLVTVFSIYRNK